MTWPQRLPMPKQVRTAFAAASAAWAVAELEHPGMQRTALLEVRRAVPGLSALLDRVTAAVQDTAAALVTGFPPDSSALVVFAAALGVVNPTFNGPAPGRLVYDILARESYQRGEDPPHNDSVFIEHPHDYIGLCCVTPGPGDSGRTVLIRAADVVEALRRRGVDTALLRDSCFPFAEPDPQDPTQGPPTVRMRAVLSGFGPLTTVLWRPTRVRAGLRQFPDSVDSAHLAALDAFADAVGSPATTTTLRLDEGDLLLIDNRRLLHGRTPIGDEGADRHLKRVKLHR
jgi:hypothetical protein